MVITLDINQIPLWYQLYQLNVIFLSRGSHFTLTLAWAMIAYQVKCCQRSRGDNHSRTYHRPETSWWDGRMY